MRVLQGRGFRGDTDRQSIVIDETFAGRFFPDQCPIGRQLTVGTGEGARTMQIIGIARNAKYHTLGESSQPFFYGLWTPGTEGPAGTVVLIRTFAAPGALIPTIRNEVHALDGSLPMPRIETLTERVQSALWLARSTAALFAAMGVMATFLATIGLYGMIAYSVSRRANEIAVRMALGAQRSDVFKMIEATRCFSLLSE